MGSPVSFPPRSPLVPGTTARAPRPGGPATSTTPAAVDSAVAGRHASLGTVSPPARPTTTGQASATVAGLSPPNRRHGTTCGRPPGGPICRRAASCATLGPGATSAARSSRTLGLTVAVTPILATTTATPGACFGAAAPGRSNLTGQEEDTCGLICGCVIVATGVACGCTTIGCACSVGRSSSTVGAGPCVASTTALTGTGALPTRTREPSYVASAVPVVAADPGCPTPLTPRAASARLGVSRGGAPACGTALAPCAACEEVFPRRH